MLFRSVREYARANPHAPVLIRNESTGEMRFLRYGKSQRRFDEQKTSYDPSYVPGRWKPGQKGCPSGRVFYKSIGKYVCKAKSGSSKGGR